MTFSSAAWYPAAPAVPPVLNTPSYSWIGSPVLSTNSRVFYSAIYLTASNTVARAGDDITLQFEDRRSVLPAVARIESLWGMYQLRAAICMCSASRISSCDGLQLVCTQRKRSALQCTSCQCFAAHLVHGLQVALMPQPHTFSIP
jgi:hypothetical protein